jgi:hypothetical protein
MSVYTVQAPASLLGEPEFEKSAFLREGFSWAAFFFAFFWLLWHRLWATAALWFVVCTALAWLSFSGLSFGGFPLITLALHILLGLEANNLLRRKHAGHGYRLVGIVTADSLEAAERTFFARAVQERTEVRAASNTTPPPLPPRSGRNGEVLGLFPEPETGY